MSAWRSHGHLMRDETWRAVQESDAILFGAIGSPDYAVIPAEHRKVDQLLRMSSARLPDYRLAPELGEHTTALLLEAGYSPESLAALREQRLVR